MKGLHNYILKMFKSQKELEW